MDSFGAILKNLPTVPVVDRACPVCGGDSSSFVAKGYDYESLTCSNEWFFVKCESCDTVFLNPIPTPEAMELVYPQSYRPHGSSKYKNIVRVLHDFSERPNIKGYRKLVADPEATVLDLGCGGGRYLRLLSREYPRWKFLGVDFSAEAVKNVRAAGFEAISGDHALLDLGRERFDLVIINQFLEHVVDPCATLAKVFSELKPGGVLNIEMPALGGWDFHAFRRSYYGIYHFPRHLTLFTSETLREPLARAGFETLTVEYSPSPQVWVSSLANVFAHRGWIGRTFWSPSNPFALTPFMLLYWLEKILTGKSSVMRVVARKPS